MKKLTLLFAILTLFCGITYGQLPKQSEPTTAPAKTSNAPSNSSSVSPSATHTTPTPNPTPVPTPTPAPAKPSSNASSPAPAPSRPTYTNGNNNSNRSSVTQSSGSHAIGGLLLGYNFNDSPSRFVFQYDFGSKSSGPLFWTLGIGAARSKSSTTAMSNTYESVAWTLRVPAYLGILIGKEDGFSMSVRGGVMYNYWLSSKTNGESIDLSGLDRSSINGSVRLCVWHFFAEYEFPFTSVGNGVWLFGVCGPF